MPASTPVSTSKTAALSRVLDGVSRGYTRYIGGVTTPEKAVAVANKFHRLYGIGCTPAQRITRKGKGQANALLVLYWPEGAAQVLWLLLATPGTGLIAEREKLLEVTGKPRLQWLEYELTRYGARGVTRWTWRRPKAEMADWYALLGGHRRGRDSAAVGDILDGDCPAAGVSWGARAELGAVPVRPATRPPGEVAVPVLRAQGESRGAAAARPGELTPVRGWHARESPVESRPRGGLTAASAPQLGFPPGERLRQGATPGEAGSCAQMHRGTRAGGKASPWRGRHVRKVAIRRLNPSGVHHDSKHTRFSITQAIAHQRDALRERLRAPGRRPGRIDAALPGVVPKVGDRHPAEVRRAVARSDPRAARALPGAARAHPARGARAGTAEEGGSTIGCAARRGRGGTRLRARRCQRHPARGNRRRAGRDRGRPARPGAPVAARPAGGRQRG